MKASTFILIFTCGIVCADFFFPSNKPEIETCFVPNDRCDYKIAQRIEQAQNTIDIQAYHLTNKEIVQALLDAYARDVKLRIILDKAAYLEADPFILNNIPVYMDDSRAIAHNKISIIDGHTVISGSMNYTEAAQKRNVENVLFINDKKTAESYEINFNNRLSVSHQLMIGD